MRELSGSFYYSKVCSYKISSFRNNSATDLYILISLGKIFHSAFSTFGEPGLGRSQMHVFGFFLCFSKDSFISDNRKSVSSVSI